MSYPDTSIHRNLVRELELYSRLKTETGSESASGIVEEARKALEDALARLKEAPDDPLLTERSPSGLKEIQALRPEGPRRMWPKLDVEKYRDRLEGALLGRMAGCTLGAPVEIWSPDKMKMLAEELGEEFPPVDYWSRVPEPKVKRYEVSPREDYTRDKIDGVPVDDDVTYTMLGLLVVEDYGPDFTTENVGQAWLKYLPYACTAEEVALINLRKGLPTEEIGSTNNPFCEWIGADIRSDPWAYLAPGWPERAAEMAWQDAYISHRREGIYGEMYFSAAIAAAFETGDPIEALRIGLTEIPADCMLTDAINWALEVAPEIRNYADAHKAVSEKFAGMDKVHTINNACLTVFGLTIGGTDFTRVIGETVAMGFDNDCTAATAGSLFGAAYGKSAIPAHWYHNFNDKIHTYLTGRECFLISDSLRRFEEQAAKIHG